jgi:hypothetical protein
MKEPISIRQFARLITSMALRQTTEYYKNVSALGIETRMKESDTFGFALALTYFLSQRIAFSEYPDRTTYLDHLSGEISAYLEEKQSVGILNVFYGSLARIQQAMTREKERNPHEVAFDHAQAVLGDKEYGKDCPGEKMFVFIGAWLEVGRKNSDFNI